MSDRSAVLALLRRSPFYAAAGEAAMAPLLRSADTRQVPRGGVLFEQRAVPEFVFLLLSGSVGLQPRAETGEETMVEIFGAGELFLVPAAVLGLPYPAAGVALTDTRTLAIPTEAFRESLTQEPLLARAAIELLSRHWRMMMDQVVDLKLRPAERRVARFLARRVPEEPGAGPAELPEPRTAIAARLGMTPETLSRSLSALEAQGLIRVAPKRADVLDRARLLQGARS
jgi:CRP/FNR family transcriptional activator FtrB